MKQNNSFPQTLGLWKHVYYYVGKFSAKVEAGTHCMLHVVGGQNLAAIGFAA